MRRHALAITAIVLASAACAACGSDEKETLVDEEFLLVQELKDYPQVLRSDIGPEIILERTTNRVDSMGPREDWGRNYEPGAAWILDDWGSNAASVGGAATFAEVFTYDGYGGPLLQSVFHYASPECSLKVVEVVREALGAGAQYTVTRDDSPVERAAVEHPEIVLGANGVVFTAAGDWHAYVADGDYLLAIYLSDEIGIPADEFIPRVAEKFHAGVRAQEG